MKQQAGWLEAKQADYKRARWRWQRLRKKRAKPELYRNAERARRQRRTAPIRALRELGWHDLLRELGCHSRWRYRHNALPGCTIVVDSHGNATIESNKKLQHRRRAWREKIVREALSKLGLVDPSPYQATLRQKRETIIQALHAMPEKTASEIAKLLGVGKSTVRRMRRQLLKANPMEQLERLAKNVCASREANVEV